MSKATSHAQNVFLWIVYIILGYKRKDIVEFLSWTAEIKDVLYLNKVFISFVSFASQIKKNFLLVDTAVNSYINLVLCCKFVL